MPILQIHDLHLKSLFQKTLVRNLHLSICAPNMLALIGPNGSGKTTLLQTLSGAIPGEHHKIWLDGQRLLDFNPKQRAQKIAFLPQHAVKNDHTLVESRIAQGLVPFYGQNTLLSEEILSKVHRIGIQLHVDHLFGRRLGTLSGGELQRVHLAKTFINEQASVYFLDEPFVFLDMEEKQSLTRFCQVLAARGKMVVFSSHEMDMIQALATHVLSLHKNTDYTFCTQANSAPTSRLISSDNTSSGLRPSYST